MRVGLLATNQHPPQTPVAERFQETVQQVRLAREVGFDLLVFGQHFLATEFQMIQPAIAAARLAAEAGSMRVGITIYLLPLLNPVAVAEEVASLDVVTGGRFIFGIGLGYRDVEDRAFGLGRGERVPRLLKHLEIIKQLWAGDAVTYASPYCNLDNARTLLRPVQQPHPPIWVAANNDRAVERAAEIGDAWVINPHATLATIRRQMGLYRTARARAGKAFPAELPMMRETLRGADPRCGSTAGATLSGEEIQSLCGMGPASRPAGRRRYDASLRGSGARPFYSWGAECLCRRDTAVCRGHWRHHHALAAALARHAACDHDAIPAFVR